MKRRLEAGDELDTLADHAPEERLEPGDDLVEVEHARLEHLPPREGEELAGQGSGLLARPRDLLDLRPERVVVGEPAQDEVAVAVDDGEDVVEVVSDAAGEAADRVHLLRLPELRLEARALLLGAAALGDVPHVAGEERAPEQLAARDRELDRELAAVGAHRGQLDAAPDDRALAALADPVHAGPVTLAERRRHDQVRIHRPTTSARV